jgi:hypothetical protein
MSAVTIEPPFPIFTDADGSPLENGYIFIGVNNLNPVTNPIAVFFDQAFSISAAQPIRTLNGFPVYQGTPAKIYVNNTDYSIQILNKNGSIVFSAGSGVVSILPVAEGGTGTSTPSLIAGSNISITGSFPNQTVAAPNVVAQSSSTGSAYLPAGTTAQRDAAPSAGYIRYNLTTGGFEGFSTVWGAIGGGGGATGAGGDEIFFENGQTVNNSYTITAGQNAGSFGPISIAGGVVVTVPSGSTWSVV